MTRRRTRIPEVGEIWAERVPRRGRTRVRAVLIETVDTTHATVKNVRTGRPSRILLEEFTSGVIAGWYRRRPATEAHADQHDDDGTR